MNYVEYWHQDAEIPKFDLTKEVYPAFSEDYIEVPPKDEECIPLGLRLKLEEGAQLNFSSIELLANHGVVVDTRIVVDDEFDGELFVNLFNHSDYPVVIAKYPQDFDMDKCLVIKYSEPIAKLHGLGDVEVVEDINKL